MSFTLLDETRPTPITARVVGDAVRVPPADVERALGWSVQPQGLCRDERCVAVPPATPLLQDGDVDLATLADLLGRPLAVDLEERAACLGAAAAERAATLRSLVAPDFTLPDLDGRPHALADCRGRKVFLLAWASW